jgi:hypothetical protein
LPFRRTRRRLKKSPSLPFFLLSLSLRAPIPYRSSCSACKQPRHTTADEIKCIKKLYTISLLQLRLLLGFDFFFCCFVKRSHEESKKRFGPEIAFCCARAQGENEMVEWGGRAGNRFVLLKHHFKKRKATRAISSSPAPMSDGILFLLLACFADCFCFSAALLQLLETSI